MGLVLLKDITMTQQLTYTVKPSRDDTPWVILDTDGNPADDVSVDLAQFPEDEPVNLVYVLTQSSIDKGFRFAGNGTLFTDARDNFNYQLSSEVFNGGTSLVVTVMNIEPDASIPADVIKELVKSKNKDKVFSKVELEANTNYEIDFRLLAEKEGKKGKLYISQDPKVTISNVPPP